MRALMLMAMIAVASGMVKTVLAEDRIIVNGTGDNQELLRTLAAVFEKANKGTKIEIPDTIGTNGGIKMVAEDKCDLARVARPFNDKEKVYNLNYKLFANCPVVFVASPSVKGIENLSYEQIVGVFSGKIASWDALGGGKQKIYIAQREVGDSCRNILGQNIPGWKEIETFPGVEIFNTPELISTIVRHENTIGFAPLSMLKGTGLTPMKVAGVQPSVESIRNGSYKLFVPFAFVWKGELKGLSKTFVDFVFSPEAQAIITEYGAVPVQ